MNSEESLCGLQGFSEQIEEEQHLRPQQRKRL